MATTKKPATKSTTKNAKKQPVKPATIQAKLITKTEEHVPNDLNTTLTSYFGIRDISSKQVKEKGKQSPSSLQIGDETIEYTQGIKYIQPPVDPKFFTMLLLESSILKQCVDALVDGIFNKGYRLELNTWFTAQESQKPRFKKAIEEEREQIIQFLENIDIDNESHTKFKSKIGQDYESTGCCYLEVIRETKTDKNGNLKVVNGEYVAGPIYAFQKLDSVSMRIVRVSKDFIPYNKLIFDKKTKKWKKEPRLKRFKIFVQIDENQNNLDTYFSYIYFKELGDPRRIDSQTGEVVTDEMWNEYSAEKKRGFQPARELIYYYQPFPGCIYGVPRFTGAIRSIVGSILKEENDIQWFNNGCKADLVFMSSNPVSPETIDCTEKYVQKSSTMADGRRALIFMPERDVKLPGEKQETVTMDVKEINSGKDETWGKYDERNTQKVKASCRLGDIHVGLNKDYNRATSEVAMEITEDNVFKPSRRDFDHIMNQLVFPQLGFIYHRYESNPSTKESITSLADAMYKVAPFGMTFREARKVIAKIFELDMDRYEAELGPDDSYWLDYVIAMGKEQLMYGFRPDKEEPGEKPQEEPTEEPTEEPEEEPSDDGENDQGGNSGE
jgi:capsid portal protein